MDRIRTPKVKIHLENDNVVMYGTPNESAGCVLRGVLNVTLNEPSKIKSISLTFTGTVVFAWTECLSNGQERLCSEERKVIDHTWAFLPRKDKIHQLGPGNYTYEFELALPGDLPESTHMADVYSVQYGFRAVVERPTFMPNHTARRAIHLSRQVLPFSAEFMEPASVFNQWSDKLNYEITLPTKMYSHGEEIPVNIRITPQVAGLRLRHVTCVFKEYMICHANQSNSRPRAHGRILYNIRDDKFGKQNASGDDSFLVWSKTLTVPVPKSIEDVQCDVQNDIVRIRHKLNFTLCVENAQGQTSELRASMPVTICAPTTTGLPSYEEVWQSLPYDPALMLQLLFGQQQDNRQLLAASCAMGDEPWASERLPTYDEHLCVT
ncbi:uncharacterized protein BYT42DRAFT_554183 [Radiomyces spectabilis]|uniref:uncharacterized protein n=1 Tax=Radiomyces spectabilis TaxID=64574 RepID=UPI00221EB85B|nr:uncharacterized protein BYT42DRAFT_554183 [Radiomyces spectabilis]KAI8394312.1 hypothetical protein BYT42DRAFT_554183 [Radiomyces spectabilis]